MKDSWEWMEEDILALIQDEVKESIDLEYKECAALDSTDRKKNEISKDVSSFANSAGGTIVYGIVEDGHKPVQIDCGFDPSITTKEWLEQVINSRVQRRIDGLRINSVDLQTTAPGRVIYVVSIPQSVRTPHMASDHRFYKRFNFQSVPMEEYEVRDVARRLDTPDLRLSLSFAERLVSLQFQEGKELSEPIDVIVRIWNETPMPADVAVIQLLCDSRIQIAASGQFHTGGDLCLSIGDFSTTVQVLSMNHSTPGKIPIFQGLRFQVSSSPPRICVPREPGEFVIGWQVHSPHMLPRLQLYILRSTGALVSIEEMSVTNNSTQVHASSA